jgi:hypothetical protein
MSFVHVCFRKIKRELTRSRIHASLCKLGRQTTSVRKDQMATSGPATPFGDANCTRAVEDMPLSVKDKRIVSSGTRTRDSFVRLESTFKLSVEALPRASFIPGRFRTPDLEELLEAPLEEDSLPPWVSLVPAGTPIEWSGWPPTPPLGVVEPTSTLQEALRLPERVERAQTTAGSEPAYAPMWGSGTALSEASAEQWLAVFLGTDTKSGPAALGQLACSLVSLSYQRDSVPFGLGLRQLFQDIVRFQGLVDLENCAQFVGDVVDIQQIAWMSASMFSDGASVSVQPTAGEPAVVDLGPDFDFGGAIRAGFDALAVGKVTSSAPLYVRAGVALLYRVSAAAALVSAGVSRLPEWLTRHFVDFRLLPGELASQLVAGVVDLITRLAMCWREGSLSPLTAPDLSGSTALLIRASELTCASLDALPGGAPGVDYYPSRIRVLRAHVAALGRAMEKYPADRAALAAAVARLGARAADLEAQVGGRSRPTPLVFLLFGPPSVGKSIVTRMLYTQVGKTWGWSTDEDAVYHATVSQKYWDNYHWAIHRTLVLDDIFSTNPDKASNADEMVAAVLAHVNDTPTPLAAAAVEEKGKHFAASELVIASTNLKKCNAHHYGTVGGMAILRRLKYVVTLAVREEYRQEGSMMLDSRLAAASADPLDLWDFVLEQAVAAKTGIEYQPIYTGRAQGLLVAVDQIARDHRAIGGMFASRLDAALTDLRSTALLRSLGEQMDACPVVVQAAESTSYTELGPPLVALAAGVALARTDVRPVVGVLALLAGLFLLQCAFDVFPFVVLAALVLPVVYKRGDGVFAVFEEEGPWRLLRMTLRDARSAHTFLLSSAFYRCSGGAVELGALDVAVSLTAYLGLRGLCTWVRWRRFRVASEPLWAESALIPGRVRWLALWASAALPQSNLARVVAGLGAAYAARAVFRASRVTAPVKVRRGDPTMASDALEALMKEHPSDWDVRVAVAQRDEPRPAVAFSVPAHAPAVDRMARNLEPVHRSMLLSDVRRLVLGGQRQMRVTAAGLPAANVIAFNLKGNLWLTVAHAFPRGPDSYEVQMMYPTGGVISRQRNGHTLVLGVSLAVDYDKDIALLHVVGEAARDRTELFLTDAGEMPIDFAGAEVSVPVVAGATLTWESTRALKRSICHTVMPCASTVPVETVRDCLLVERPPPHGESGGFAVVSLGAARFITGPVFGRGEAAGKPVGMLRFVARPEIAALESQLRVLGSIPPTMSVLDASLSSLVMSSTDTTGPRTWTNTLGVGKFSGRLLGYLDKGSHPRSRVVETPLRRRLWSLVEEVDAFKVAPPMRPLALLLDGEWAWMDPTLVNLRALENTPAADPRWSAWAAHDYFVPLAAALGQTRYAGDAFLTREEALFGRRGDPNLDALNWTTSSGPSWGGAKATYLEPQLDGSFALRADVAARCDDLLARLLAPGETTLPPFIAQWHLKDEPISLSKAEQWRVRAFSAMDQEVIITGRQILGPIIAAMQTVSWEFSESAVGINCAGSEWGALRQYLADYSEMGLDGDHKYFDKIGSEDHRAYIAGGWYRLALGIGYSPDKALAVYRFVWAQNYHVAFIGYTLVLLDSSEPSGGLGTVQLNSCRSAFLMRLAWCSHWAEKGVFPPPPYRKHNRLINFGDDHANTSRDPDFNFFAVQKALARLGLGYTPADKGENPPPLRPLSELTFLKRKFRDSPYGTVAPLELKSIVGMMAYARRSPSIADDVRDAQCVENAQRELWFHGEEVFERYTGEMRRAVMESVADGYDPRPRWFTFDDLTQVYLAGTLDTWDSATRARGRWRETGVSHVDAAEATSAPDAGGLSAGSNLAAQEGSDHTSTGTSKAVSDVSTTLVRHSAAPLTYAVRPEPLEAWWSRPIEIATLTWASGGAFADPALAPLSLYLFSSPTVLRKIANHRLFRGGVRIHIQVGGSPFHYGAMKVAFLPGGLSARTIVPASIQLLQLPGVIIDPAGTPTIVFDLPYAAPFEFIDLEAGAGATPSGAGFFGSLHFLEIKALNHTTLATAPSVTIQVRASLISPHFASPTSIVGATVTSGPDAEQTTEGLISIPATMVADALWGLGDIPFIGPLARAGAQIATGVAGVAAFFGYSRPVMVAAVQPVAHAPFRDHSNFISPDWAPGGSLDPKIGTLVDPRTVGLGPEDQMSLAYVARREGYVYGAGAPSTFEWLPTMAVGTVVASIPVCPMTKHLAQSGFLTPVGIAACAFSRWSGTLEFRVTIVANNFFKGRLRVMYYPSSGTEPAIPLSPLARHTAVLDISQTKEVVFCIGWQQLSNSLPLPRFLSECPSSASGVGVDSAFQNGLLYFVVDGVLISQQTAEGVGLLVSMRGGKDLGLHEPSMLFIGQTSATSAPDSEARVECVELVPSLLMPWSEQVSVGERITHVRSLCHRYTPAFTFQPLAIGAGTTASATRITFSHPRRLWRSPFVLPNGGTGAGWRDRYQTPYEFYRACYLGERGAHRYRYLVLPNIVGTGTNVATPEELGMGYLYRDGIQHSGLAPIASPGTNLTFSQHVVMTGDSFPPVSLGGTSLQGMTPSSVRDGHPMALSHPFVGPMRYLWPGSTPTVSADTHQDPLCVFVLCAVGLLPDGPRPFIQVHHTVGDDFSFFGFLFSPVLAAVPGAH